jgi:hypothetical protein
MGQNKSWKDDNMNKAESVKRTNKWGDWKFDKGRLVLELKEDRYEIDLEEITDSAQMLDWIFQLYNKGWTTPQEMYDLLGAFQALFVPQATLCSFGVNREIDPVKVIGKNIRNGLNKLC